MMPGLQQTQGAEGVNIAVQTRRDNKLHITRSRNSGAGEPYKIGARFRFSEWCHIAFDWTLTKKGTISRMRLGDRQPAVITLKYVEKEATTEITEKLEKYRTII